ncbi:MAG: hypothetical protein PVH11_08775 [Anaerolineae bacterium]|jgi:hypothetical protein
MIKLQGDDRPTYILRYPRMIRWTKGGLILFLVIAALLQWGSAWVRYLRPVIEVIGTSIDPIPVLTAQPLRPLIGAHLSLLFVAGAIAFLYAALPDLSLAEGGLAARTALGWRAIPWASITTVRLILFEESPRTLVLVQGTWSRWSPWPRLVSMCLGAGFEPGLLFTSDIQEFRPFIQRLYDEVTHISPDALFDDEFFSLPVRLVLEPGATLDILAEQVSGEGWPLNLSAQAMAAVPAGLAVVNLLLMAIYGGGWWKPLVIIGLCEVEWLIGAFYLYALAEFFPAEIEYQQAALLYPLPQVPRALLTVPMAILVAAGLAFPAALVGLVGVIWSVLLTTFLVQKIYRLDSILPAMLGGAVQALYQFMILALAVTR